MDAGHASFLKAVYTERRLLSSSGWTEGSYVAWVGYLCHMVEEDFVLRVAKDVLAGADILPTANSVTAKTSVSYQGWLMSQCSRKRSMKAFLS